MKEFQRCKRCVMDNSSDATIVFDESGICNYCTSAISKIGIVYFPNDEGRKILARMIARIKAQNRGKKYDCIMGISGGLDSSYLAYLGAAHWNLRILAVHIDDGYDTDISKSNIKKLCGKANIDLITISPNAKEFDEITRAYMLAGVPNLAVPQDNVLLACIYKFMKQNNIRTFLSGGNFALECILQSGNTHDPFDLINVKDIYKRFGRVKLNNIEMISNFNRDINALIHRIEMPRPLDYIDYNRERALKELNDFCGFEYYGSKHLENTLTKFIQLYWFYNKFGVDKRTSHLSSMIVSNQMTREEAIKELEKPIYDPIDMNKDIAVILKRVGFTWEEFDAIMASPSKQHSDYKMSSYVKARRRIISGIRKHIKKK